MQNMNFIPHSTYRSRATYIRRIGMGLGATTIALEGGLVLWQLATRHLQFHLQDTIIFSAIMFLGGFVVFIWREHTSYLDDGTRLIVGSSPAQQTGGNPASTEGAVSGATIN